MILYTTRAIIMDGNLTCRSGSWINCFNACWKCQKTRKNLCPYFRLMASLFHAHFISSWLHCCRHSMITKAICLAAYMNNKGVWRPDVLWCLKRGRVDFRRRFCYFHAYQWSNFHSPQWRWLISGMFVDAPLAYRRIRGKHNVVISFQAHHYLLPESAFESAIT